MCNVVPHDLHNKVPSHHDSQICLLCLCVPAGDWLQGPYVYHLYEHYGFSVRDIGRLFIMGFGSSAVFGTLAGAMADYRCAGAAAVSLHTGCSCVHVCKKPQSLSARAKHKRRRKAQEWQACLDMSHCQ
jgi:hypothetical protein